MKDDDSIIPLANEELIKASGADTLLSQIKPYWQAKSLIQRVQNLLRIDPSSACQRIFNAALHDLRKKIIIAGLDLASEAARQNNLPTVSRKEDIENLSPSRVIDLCYRMGLLTRPEYRKMLRVYDIRKDIEHEDDEYCLVLEKPYRLIRRQVVNLTVFCSKLYYSHKLLKNKTC